MRILLAYNGLTSSTRRYQNSDLLEDLHHFPTTHMSEVNYLLFGHWLQEAGHSVSMLIENPLPSSSYLTHFNLVSLIDLDPSLFDILFLFKVHGQKLAARHNLMRHSWRQVVAWSDTPNPDNVLGAAAWKVNAWAWGTPEMLALGKGKFPKAVNVLSEHATVFAKRPTLGPTEMRGLFAGRLPLGYAEQVRLASQVSPMLVMALWVQDEGNKILLRPSQIKEGALKRAQDIFPNQVDLRVATNVIAKAGSLSRAAFGLCPATDNRVRQILSASKFYDYLALGLPVVLADNTPEAAHIKANLLLGSLYTQGDTNSLHRAIHQCLMRAQGIHFFQERVAIQNWVFQHATYHHRARIIQDVLIP